MRQWQAQKTQLKRFTAGDEVISVIFQGPEGNLCREDRLASDPEAKPAGLGWWRWTVGKRPPTQKELNERLEQLWQSLKESQAPHKEALAWLVGLYLTRKKILRQEAGGFVHVKSGERTEVRQENLSPEQVQAAMQELMAVIS